MNLLNRFINWGLCLFVFLLPWQTRWIYHDEFVRGSVWEYGRLSLYGTEILLAVLIILVLVGNWRRHCEACLAGRSNPVVLTTLAIIVYSALSILWATDKTLAAQGLLRIVEGAVLFWLIIDQIRSNAWLKDKFKLSLIGAGLVQGGLAIYQFFTQSTFAFKWLGLSLIDVREPGTSAIEFLDERWLRAYGALPHPNILGGFLAICLLVAIIGLWNLKERLKQSSEITKQDYWLNLFHWMAIVIMFIGLLFSFSRSGALALIIGFIYLTIIAFRKKLKSALVVNLKTAVVFLAIVGLFLVGFPYQLLTTRLDPQARLEKWSLEQRLSAQQQAQTIFKEQPLLGVGLGNYTKVMKDKITDAPGWYYQPVHSWYWLVLTELGVIVFLLFAFLIVNLWRKTDSISRSLIIALLILGLFDHYLFSLYFGIIFWWLIMSLAPKDLTQNR
ncbi:MAG: O-antigen ligase family protein [Candidatus Komeilibacteria bacterium]|nr:O-antigen ligase family protein [Candidatus Komeilibacteria bacterium]